MPLDRYVYADGKRLRCGYTTGVCASLAAGAAAQLLLTGTAPAAAGMTTPSGTYVEAEILKPSLHGEAACEGGCSQNGLSASCAVMKDGGDDMDATDGALIEATVRLSDSPGIKIDGGEGVGRVTRPGLDQPVGAAAINQVPREMIRDETSRAAREVGYEGGLEVIISVPGGEKIAEKTFNPELGIEGGISILGTSGIVEPMSVQAIVETITLELRQQAQLGSRHVILTPGNYGMDYIRRQGLAPVRVPVVKCSNYIGEALDAAAAESYHSVLLVGHVGKLVKLAGGIMNTHSRMADCRMELFCAHAAVCGAGTEICRQLMDAPTTDACLDILEREGLKKQVMESLTRAADRQLRRRVSDDCEAGAVIFSLEHGLLGETSGVKNIRKMWETEGLVDS